MVQPYNGILLTIKRKELLVPYHKGITPNERSKFLNYILYDPIFMTFWKPSYSNREHISGSQGFGVNAKGQHKDFF